VNVCGKERWVKVLGKKKKKKKYFLSGFLTVVFVLLLKLLMQWGSFQFFMAYQLFIVSFGLREEKT